MTEKEFNDHLYESSLKIEPRGMLRPQKFVSIFTFMIYAMEKSLFLWSLIFKICAWYFFNDFINWSGCWYNFLKLILDLTWTFKLSTDFFFKSCGMFGHHKTSKKNFFQALPLYYFFNSLRGLNILWSLRALSQTLWELPPGVTSFQHCYRRAPALVATRSWTTRRMSIHSPLYRLRLPAHPRTCLNPPLPQSPAVQVLTK